MTETAAPPRSRQQRMEALQTANDVRHYRAEFKGKLKEGKVDPRRELRDPDANLETAKVGDFLRWCPKIGRVKAKRLLAQCRISPSKTIGGLSERQRLELVAQIGMVPPYCYARGAH